MIPRVNIFFKGLNELRAIAAIAVVFFHVEQHKEEEGLNSLIGRNVYIDNLMRNLGPYAVYLFFVISGFLITYLLLVEKETKKEMSIKNFYKKRVLRIWPLYYIILIISFLLIPYLANNFQFFQQNHWYAKYISNSENYTSFSLFLYLLILPNIAIAFFSKIVMGATQTWSIGVEEQFYLIWPFIVKYLKTKALLRVFILIILLINTPFFLSHILDLKKGLALRILTGFEILLPSFRIDLMAIGGVFGLLVYNRNKLIEFVRTNFLFKTIVLGFFFFVFFMKFNPIYIPFFGILCGFLIIIITDENSKYNLRNVFLSKIGTVSYGVYMYHFSIMFCVFPIFRLLIPDRKGLLYDLGIYVVLFLLTYLLSFFSYKYIEKKFIGKKKNLP